MELPVFRSDLRIIKNADRNGVLQYLVEDQASGELFALGEEEYFLCKQLDGQTSLMEIQSRFEKQFNSSLDIKQLGAFVLQMEEKGLLIGSKSKQFSIWEIFQFQSPETWKRWNLFNPDRLLAWFSKRLWYCYTWPFVVLSLLIFFLASGVVFFHFEEVLNEIRLQVKPLTLFQMFITMYLVVNIPGEFVRGVTSAYFGTRVYEYGIWLAYDIVPRFYCLSNVWEMKEKSRRIWTLFSPSFYALLIGSIGILMRKMTTPAVFLHKFGLTIGVICVFDSLIRLNFLWPGEAHYILSNLWDMENFRKRSLRTAKSWILRRPMPEPLSVRDKRLLVSYGFLTAVATFPSLVFLGYIIGKSLIEMLAGIGCLIFISMISIKYRKPILTIIKGNKMVQWIFGKNSKIRKFILLVLWLTIIISVMIVPYYYEPGGPFRLMPFERIELHSQMPGEIKQVFVKENDTVNRGDVQALIDMREDQKNLDVYQADLERAKADLRLLEKGPKPEEIKKAEQQLESARTQLGYSKKEEERLKSLFKEHVIPEEEYMNAARKADVDSQNLDVAKANLDLVKSGTRPEEIEAQRAVVSNLEAKVKYYTENVGLARLVAPISGKVITPYMETKVGKILKEGDLFAIYENSEIIQAEIQLPEADIGEVKIGAKVRIRPEAYPLKLFYGDVVLIASSAETTPNGKVIRVLTNIPNPNHELKPEMTGEAKIEGEWKPFIIAFTRPLVRFVMIELWSWLP